ncbi:MAG: MFS transporter [Thermoplasmata archaeon]
MYNINLHTDGTKNFRLIVTNAGISRAALSAYNLVIIWVVLLITKNPILAGLSDSMMTVPLILSFIVGAYVDRIWNKKAVAMAAALLRFALICLILIADLTRITVIIVLTIYFSTFLIGFTSDILDSIRASWTKAFLTEDFYKRGTSEISSVTMAAQAIGFIVSGVIISTGVYNSFMILSVILLISVFPLIPVKHSNYGGSGSVKEYVKAGLKLAWKDKRIREIIIMGLIGNFIIGMAGIMFISLVQIGFRLPGIFVSLLFGLLVFGMAGGSIAGQKISGKIGLISIVSYTVIGLSLFSISFLNSIFLTMIPAFFAGLSMGIGGVAVNTAIMRIVPSEMMARIQGSFNTFGIAASSFSSIIGGTLYEFLGQSWGFAVLGISMIMVNILILLFKDFSEMRY